ncbi:hypothetical protein [Rhizobacter fulvus]
MTTKPASRRRVSSDRQKSTEESVVGATPAEFAKAVVAVMSRFRDSLADMAKAPDEWVEREVSVHLDSDIRAQRLLYLLREAIATVDLLQQRLAELSRALDARKRAKRQKSAHEEKSRQRVR